jgi:eukaryotic-like serine/threonine-protein kinase
VPAICRKTVKNRHVITGTPHQVRPLCRNNLLGESRVGLLRSPDRSQPPTSYTNLNAIGCQTWCLFEVRVYGLVTHGLYSVCFELRVHSKNTSPPPSVHHSGGKEELRASILKPYLLRLREEKGEKAVRALLSKVGLPPTTLENETAWISVSAARRALAALESALGRAAIARRGNWMVHPENLGTYVRLLRVASNPIDGFRQLAEHSQEATRVGHFEMEELKATQIRVTYIPDDVDETPQDDELLCLARESELASIPTLWGLEEADIVREKSLANGDSLSSYLISWKSTRPQSGTPIGAGVGAVISAVPVMIAGNWIAVVISGVIGAVFGGVIGRFYDRMAQERASRMLEKNRIAALERGLELRGDVRDQAIAPGELDGAILGGKYKIIRKIGSGGIGVVYSAEHVTLGSTVAIKVLRGAAARDAAEIARLRREAQVQVRIEHPNVIRTLDLDQMPDGSIYVVMELLRGRSLADKLNMEGPVAPGFALPVFIQVCRGLWAAHSAGVVHRDLKPGNIFLCDDSLIKVLDFGMSKFQSAESLTQEGYTLGTPEYMAPEQCIGANVEPRTDLYAFGVLMYEALTGELPIQTANRRELLDLHQRQVPKPMRKMRPDLPIPEELDRAIMSCLRKRIAERPRDARDLERMLASVPLDGLPTMYSPPAPRTASEARQLGRMLDKEL